MFDDAVRASWKAVAWMVGLNVLGSVLVVGALVSTLCLFCGSPEPMSDGWEAALALGIVALVAGPALAARTTGWPLWILVGIGASLLGLLTFRLVAGATDGAVSALVLALAVEGAVAIRPRVPGAVAARVAAILALAIVSTALGWHGGLSLAVLFLALPAIALADTVAAHKTAGAQALA
jgi:hypothetical protein